MPATYISGAAAVKGYGLIAAGDELRVYSGEASLETTYTAGEAVGSNEAYIRRLHAEDTGAGPRAVLVTTLNNIIYLDPVEAETIWIWSNDTVGTINPSI